MAIRINLDKHALFWHLKIIPLLYFYFFLMSTVWNSFNELLNITSKLLVLWGWHYSSQRMSCPNTVFCVYVHVPSAQQKTGQNILPSIAAHIGYTKGQDTHLIGKHKNKYIKISLVSDTFMMIAQWDPTRNCRNYTVRIYTYYIYA